MSKCNRCLSYIFYHCWNIACCLKWGSMLLKIIAHIIQVLLATFIIGYSISWRLCYKNSWCQNFKRWILRVVMWVVGDRLNWSFCWSVVPLYTRCDLFLTIFWYLQLLYTVLYMYYMSASTVVVIVVVVVVKRFSMPQKSHIYLFHDSLLVSVCMNTRWFCCLGGCSCQPPMKGSWLLRIFCSLAVGSLSLLPPFCYVQYSL